MTLRTFSLILSLSLTTAFALAHDGDKGGEDFGQPGNPLEINRTVKIEMRDSMRFSPDKLKVKKGDTASKLLLAHPVQLHVSNDAQLETVLKNLMDMGLLGLETMHADHGGNLMEKYGALALRLGLLQTGGTDFHGEARRTIQLGVCHRRRVPREFYDLLVAAWRSPTG